MLVIKEIKNGKQFNKSNDVYNYLKDFKNQDREFFIVLGLDSKNKVIYREICSIGILNMTLVSPSTIYRKALLMASNSIVIAHNHPSGDPDPSDEDIKITEKLKKAGEILNIKLLDHIIIGEDKHFEYYSFADEGKL